MNDKEGTGDDGALTGLTVMVVDDSNTIRRSAETFLKQAGCQVILAEDGFDALAKVAGVHRATVARRIIAAKEALSDGVKARLKEALALDSSAVEQVVTLDNLDESLSAILRRTRR